METSSLEDGKDDIDSLKKIELGLKEENNCEIWLVPIVGYLLGLMATISICTHRGLVNWTQGVLVFSLASFVAVTMIFTIVSVMLLFAAIQKDSKLVKRYFWLSVVHLCLQNLMAVVIPVVLLLDGSAPTVTTLNWMIVIMIVGLGWTHFVLRFKTFRDLILSYSRY